MSGPELRAARASRVWYMVVGVVLAIVAVSLLVSAAAVSPTYCGLCHGSARSALSESEHTSLACDRCHVEPGVYGLIESRLSVVSMLPAAVTPGRGQIATYVSNDVCLECHVDVLTTVSATAGIRMSHAEVEEAKWSCTRCHAGTAHGREDVAPLGSYTMGDCLQCHNSNPGQTEGCATCHVAGAPGQGEDRAITPWRVTHGANWESAHGMGDLDTCKACHRPDYCVRCHQMAIPHAPTFKKTHGKFVAGDEALRTSCQVCHKGRVCDDCHGLPMPHPDGFLQAHSKSVTEDGSEVCDRCHATSSCDECHTRHAHPGLKPDYIEQLRDRPVS